MDIALSFFKEFINLGASVMLPVVIALLGLFFRMKPSQAVRAGLLVGIGFQGVVLTINFLLSTIQPALDYYTAMGSGYDVAEIGFAALGGASWTTPFAVFAIPAIVIINIILLRLKATKVLNVDIWNFMHFLVPGALAYVLFGNAIIGFLVAVALSVVTLFAAEKVAPKWGEFFGLDGTACTCLGYIVYEYPMAAAINWVIDHIPGLNKIDLDLDTLSQKIGILGDPAIIGLFVGGFLGLMTQQDAATIIKMCAGMAAVMVLLPRMVAIMMEGLAPIGAGANEFVKNHIDPDANIYVGMDIALALGDPCCITCTAIMIPVTVAWPSLSLTCASSRRRFWPRSATLRLWPCSPARATSSVHLSAWPCSCISCSSLLICLRLTRRRCLRLVASMPAATWLPRRTLVITPAI